LNELGPGVSEQEREEFAQAILTSLLPASTQPSARQYVYHPEKHGELYETIEAETERRFNPSPATGENPHSSDLQAQREIPTDTPTDISPLDRQFSEMADGNAKFRTYCAKNDIAIIHNKGVDNNCLITALLQHATGDYLSDHREMAATLRANLPGNASLLLSTGHFPMLYPDGGDETFRHLLAVINARYDTKLEVFAVQATEEGRPVFDEVERTRQPDTTPVMIWQQGAHFAALVKSSKVE